MSEPTAAPAKTKSKSKKLIIGMAVLALLLVAGGAAAWLLLAKRSAVDEEDAPVAKAQAAAPKTPPTFLPMENMVVNLADPGGDRFAQVGITLELADAKTSELLKTYMPSIRSSVLLLVSQRTTDELLTREGKEKLAGDIRREALRPLGLTEPKPLKRPVRRDPEGEDDEVVPQRPKVDDSPVRQVLFSSFIIQ
ncbi:flagellar basal body-associated protein FliL [Alicycliphilus denitrificans]|uniref:flagellar basal body-associated FliL family protein n=1 Tax=Alicycliphilus denitrificans TaxID=179636 RepID=UPI0038504C31